MKPFMSILKSLQFQNTIQYNTILEEQICFSDSMSSVILKIGKPNSIAKSDVLTTLEYKKNLHTFISKAYYGFVQNELCSVCYETDALTGEQSELFQSDIKNLINQNAFDSVMNYICCGKEYWELSGGDVSMSICLYAENDKIHIKIKCFD